LWIVEQRVLVELRLELVDEIDQPARAVDYRRPSLRSNLSRRWLHFSADVRAFQAIPYLRLARRPGAKPVDSLRHQAELVRLAKTRDRVDVERNDIAPKHIGFVIVELGAVSPSDPGVVCDALAKVEHDRPIRVDHLHSPVGVDDFRWGN